MSVIDRAKNILLAPKTEWLVIRSEHTTVTQMLTGYVLPLTVIPAGVALLSGLLWSSSISNGIINALMAVICSVVSFYIGTYVADALAPNFSSEKNLDRSAQLVGYSYTASAVASILGFVPFLGALVTLVGFGYSVYLMALGVTPLKATPEDKKIGYVVVIILVELVVYFIVSSILAAIFIRRYYYY